MKGKWASRKYFLFWVVLAILLVVYGAVLVMVPTAITEVSVGVFIGAVLLLYLIYVFGNVLSKVKIGDAFQADFSRRENDNQQS